jgi:hypothetical protein
MASRTISLTVVLAATLILTLAVAGCGGASAGRAPESSTTTGTTTTTTTEMTTVTANRAAAEREAQRLLGLVPIPDGAVALTAPPDGLDDVPDRPMVDSFAVRSRFWTLQVPYQQAKAWIDAHPPIPLRWTVHGSGSGGPHGSLTTWGTDQSTSSAWQWARATASLVGSDGSTSTMRVDGMAVWLDPTPYPDDVTAGAGQRVRVTVASGCPASDRSVGGVTGDGPDLDTQLLPGPNATAALACRYSGLNGGDGKPALTLIATHRLDAAAARRLAVAVLALRLAHPVGAVGSCGGNDGSAVLVALTYPGRPDVDLWIATTGCQVIANGHIRTDSGPAIAGLAAI